MEKEVFKGEIYYIYPRETVGCEMAGGRPGIIVSNNVGNAYSKIVEVVYLTTKEKRPLPTHVEINSTARKSTALCEQIETVSKERIGDYIGSVSQMELDELERALLISHDINCNVKSSKKLSAWEKLIEELESEEEISLNDMEEIIKKQPVINLLPQPEKGNLETDPEYIKVCTERDVYKELYLSLLSESRRTA